jgi:hypothetical protein
MTNNKDADDQRLSLALHIEWLDHFQTRRQTWKALEVSALCLAAFVLAGLRIDNRWIVTVLGAVVVCGSLAGAVMSWHHRKAQVRKFTHIDRLENALGLHEPGLLDDVHPPRAFRLSDIVDPRETNTPLFVLRMHLVVAAFTIVYLVGRWMSR